MITVVHVGKFVAESHKACSQHVGSRSCGDHYKVTLLYASIMAGQSLRTHCLPDYDAYRIIPERVSFRVRVRL